jgi:predicted DNA-binding transcriptional regulator AlpA
VPGPDPVVVSATTRERCLEKLLRHLGGDDVLTVREIPDLVGVAEAASILGWDKRRIFTYLARGSFPEPIAALASGRVWLRDDIDAYSRSRWKGPRTPEAR